MKYIKGFELFVEGLSTKDLDIYDKYYSDINKVVYELILNIQPKQRIYKDWLLKLYRKGKLIIEDLYKAEEYLMFFDRPNIKSKFGGESFIKTIEDLPSLAKLLEPYKSVELSDKELKDKVYSDCFIKEFEDYNLYIPQSYEDSCKLGKGTEWCTATENTAKYYYNYTRTDNLLIFISKTDSTDKYQLHITSKNFMDKYDQEIDPVEFFENYPDIKEYIFSLKNDKNILSLYELSKEETLIEEWLNNHKDINEFIDLKLNNLTEFKIADKPNSIFYMNDKGEYILGYNKQVKILDVIYRNFIEVLFIKNDFDINDITNLIKFKVKELYKLNFQIINPITYLEIISIEKEFKLKNNI